MQSGPFTRSRAMQKNYAKKRSGHTKGCIFCRVSKNNVAQIIEARKHCLILRNIHGYDMWDGFGVVDHLMVIPRRHVVGLSELTKAEKMACLEAMTEYEAQGYSLYARAPENSSKTVVHQHTHLIKIDNKRKRWLLHIRRPHVRLMG